MERKRVSMRIVVGGAVVLGVTGIAAEAVDSGAVKAALQNVPRGLPHDFGDEWLRETEGVAKRNPVAYEWMGQIDSEKTLAAEFRIVHGAETLEQLGDPQFDIREVDVTYAYSPGPYHGGLLLGHGGESTNSFPMSPEALILFGSGMIYDLKSEIVIQPFFEAVSEAGDRMIYAVNYSWGMGGKEAVMEEVAARRNVLLSMSPGKEYGEKPYTAEDLEEILKEAERMGIGDRFMLALEFNDHFREVAGDVYELMGRYGCMLRLYRPYQDRMERMRPWEVEWIRENIDPAVTFVDLGVAN